MTQRGATWGTAALARLARAASGLATLCAAAACLAVASPASAASPVQLIYRVDHSIFGNIGTYSNTIQTGGDTTTVSTTAHFRVRVLGVVMHREDATRTERWNGDRLVYFHSITNKGGGPIEVTGEATASGFVIRSPKGTVTAPAAVHPANPWSPNFLASHTMMRVDNGRIERVNIRGGGEVPVKLPGQTIFARAYEVDGATRYRVWIDGRGVPVQFTVDDASGKITFTLTDCVGCELHMLYAGQQR
ncbi:MAG TPA: DUF6134 family protein [Stellaceae bacterium]|nr:DUF6134 family protein [Stellaceae bacterium]